MGTKLSGLIAATYTPMDAGGHVVLDQIDLMANHLVKQQVDGFYVCGSTGEGVSLTSDERTQVAARYVAAGKRLGVPVVVQVGHNSLFEASQLAEHAASIGATAISANAPSYFKVEDVETLVECMAVVAAGAPSLPFYYYHIPSMAGANFDVIQFMELASQQIPNLAGVKYTALTVHGFQECLQWRDGRYDVFWGADEMLLSALAVGADGAVGSTYNIAAPLYQQIIKAFHHHEIEQARKLMSRAVAMIRVIYQYPFHSAMKAVLGMQGIECGRCRLPQRGLQDSQRDTLRDELEAIGFFEWSLAST